VSGGANVGASVKIRFHKKIYPRSAIDAATEAFAGTGRFTTRADGDHLVVEIEPEAPGDEAEVRGEFSNYVLGETIALRGDR